MARTQNKAKFDKQFETREEVIYIDENWAQDVLERQELERRFLADGPLYIAAARR